MRQHRTAPLSAAAACAEETAAALGVEVWDTELKKEGASVYLRIYIDKDGGVGVEDCERFMRAVRPLIDAIEPEIEFDYCEVSSPGIERALRSESQLARCLGWQVNVRFFDKLDGRKSISGRLAAAGDGMVTVETAEGPLAFPLKAASSIKAAADFSWEETGHGEEDE